jgi:hypothetical protein
MLYQLSYTRVFFSGMTVNLARLSSYRGPSFATMVGVGFEPT